MGKSPDRVVLAFRGRREVLGKMGHRAGLTKEAGGQILRRDRLRKTADTVYIVMCNNKVVFKNATSCVSDTYLALAVRIEGVPS